MKKAIILGLALCVGAFGAYKVMQGAEELNAQKAEATLWIETDSLEAINAASRLTFRSLARRCLRLYGRSIPK